MTAEEIARKYRTSPDQDDYAVAFGVLMGKLHSFNVFKSQDVSGVLFDKMFSEILK